MRVLETVEIELLTDSLVLLDTTDDSLAGTLLTLVSVFVTTPATVSVLNTALLTLLLVVDDCTVDERKINRNSEYNVTAVKQRRLAVGPMSSMFSLFGVSGTKKWTSLRSSRSLSLSHSLCV